MPNIVAKFKGMQITVDPRTFRVTFDFIFKTHDKNVFNDAHIEIPILAATSYEQLITALHTLPPKGPSSLEDRILSNDTCKNVRKILGLSDTWKNIDEKSDIEACRNTLFELRRRKGVYTELWRMGDQNNKCIINPTPDDSLFVLDQSAHIDDIIDAKEAGVARFLILGTITDESGEVVTIKVPILSGKSPPGSLGEALDNGDSNRVQTFLDAMTPPGKQASWTDPQVLIETNKAERALLESHTNKQ
jgi:hypothetical protein